MKVELKKGDAILTVNTPESSKTRVIQPSFLPEGLNEEKIVRDSICDPIGTPSLKQMIHPGETVAIVTSDNTRPVPTWIILPVLIDALHGIGVENKDISIYFARGSHRNMTRSEQEQLVGSRIFHEIGCYDSDWEQARLVGATKRGTKVCIDQRILDVDHVICIGNVEYHYFAGFSGGAKAIFPGMATCESIAMNHCHMVEEGAVTSQLEGNPVREDIEEACSFVKVDAIINVVLNTKKQIIASYFGDVRAAHRKACAYYDSIYHTLIPQKADIVIVSQGGAPKDRNLYQTQKALDNASHAVRDGGMIILVGACKEGFGQKTFEEWMLKYQDPYAMTAALQEHFALGGHKACAIANIRKKADIILVSDMDASVVEQTFLTPCGDVQEAVDACVHKYGENAEIICMPYGGSTLPKVM